MNKVAINYILLNDLIGPIGGAIADNYPSAWPNCLRQNRSDRVLDVWLFVICRRQKYVGAIKCVHVSLRLAVQVELPVVSLSDIAVTGAIDGLPTI